jgi:putative hydrolase of the HAD superfamily
MQAVIFDLDETLVLEESAVKDTFIETCRPVAVRYRISTEEFHDVIRREARALWHKSPVRKYCLDVGISSIEGLWGRLDGDYPNLQILREWSPQYRLNSWNNSLQKFGIDNPRLAAELADAFIQNRRKYHILYNDVLPCLNELSKIFLLGLLTNGAPYIQREKIDSSGLGKYFREIVISGEIGYGKPDTRIYQLLLTRLGTSPGSSWIVGDSLETDILGAASAGIKTIWLNRQGKSCNGSVTPDYEVNNLHQLIALLKGYFP